MAPIFQRQHQASFQLSKNYRSVNPCNPHFVQTTASVLKPMGFAYGWAPERVDWFWSADAAKAGNALFPETNSLKNGFPKCSRLRKSADYKRVYAHGSKKVGQYLQIFYLPNGSISPRFGMSVGSRVGNAVKRNRLKRWIREAIRKNKGFIRSGLDIVIHPRLRVVTNNSESIQNELQKLLRSVNSAKEIGIFEESHPDLP